MAGERGIAAILKESGPPPEEGHRIVGVAPGSVAEKCGVRPGDTLLSINGEPVRDQIDYQFWSAQGKLRLDVGRNDGPVTIYLRKDEGEPLGLTLSDTLAARARFCANRCVFCFIDQMPPGLRETLYVKDDDWRLSLMMGNYITLTNIPEEEFQRIIARKAGPLYISVHATDGAVRAGMMGNPRAGRVREQLARLKDAGIPFHCQAVLCPGINDGPVLDETIGTLSAFHPTARSLALVPVGLTRFREGLFSLAPYGPGEASRLLDQALRWQEKLLPALGTRFVFPADEFYCLSGRPLPPDGDYESYPQVENGVGLLRSFEGEFAAAGRLADPLPKGAGRRVLVATGVSAAPFLRALLANHPVEGVDVDVRAVVNRFFGPSVTVAGLLCGRDLADALAGSRAEELLLPRCMLRAGEDRFLDGMTLQQLSRALAMPVRAVTVDGAAFYCALAGDKDPWED